ncbi:DUF5906 domain-containing protein [Avibacterium sp. 20-15]|uniref:primase-helicase family protein n=1 Tax=unclassified Avibacterium TaxID=2685287 RepID=UPI00202683CA|nr:MULTISPECIES: DUF5906 domain-containing protein [unclassified Avibacterium]MCW9733722.1 DUF5906 domain-containing protein [Avibacterium sp. 20-15]URL03571.1 DUF5906 domain-containing protein [Avibacterium sp. 20-132]
MKKIIYGALPTDWEHFTNLGLGADLLPVVSDPNVGLSPRSRIKEKGKLPSVINNEDMIAGLSNWTNRQITPEKINQWKKDDRLGVCIRTGNILVRTQKHSGNCLKNELDIRVNGEKISKFDIRVTTTRMSKKVKNTSITRMSDDITRMSEENSQIYIYGLDIDCENEEIVNFVANTLHQYFGKIPPKRFRANSKKCLFLIGIENAQLPKRILRLTEGGLIEFLGKGQQFVAIGTHPSGVRYEWEGGLPTEIPVISAAEFETLWESLPLVMDVVDSKSQNLSRTRDLTQGNAHSSDDVANFLDKKWQVFSIGKRGERFIRCPFEDDHSGESSNETATAYFPADTGGFEQGHFKCQHAHCAHRTDSDFLDAIGYYEGMFEPLKANDKATPDDKVAEFVRRYIYMAENDRVYDLDSDRHNYAPKFSEFKNFTANITIFKQDGKKPVEVPVWKEWLRHPKRQSVLSAVYLPGREFIIEDKDGSRYLNEFHFPEIPFVESQEKLPHFLHHMAYLIPREEERKHFIQWMASLRQRPERRNKVTNMLVSTPHGTGRGWVVELLQHLLGKWNCTKCKMHELVDGQFNNFMHRSILCSVEEVKERSERFAVSDKVRDTLTENDLEINLKYGAKKTMPVYTNFFFMTNHTDALVLKEEDRRINVFGGPDHAKEKAYYDHLYSLLNDKQFIAEVYSYLVSLDLSDYRWTHSFDTPARRKMIDFNRSDLEVAFLDFLSQPPAKAMTIAQIMRYLTENNEDLTVDQMALRKLLQEHISLQATLKFKGKKLRPWILDNSVDLSDLCYIREQLEMAENAVADFESLA